MPFHYILFRCGVCDGQLVADVAGEICCSECGVVYADLADAKPMHPPKKPSMESFIEKQKTAFVRSKGKAKGKGGRPRTRQYLKLRRFLRGSYIPYIKPKTTTSQQIYSATIVATFKRAMWKLSVDTWFPQFIRCPKCGGLNDGASVEFTIDIKHDPPRIRVPLPCKHSLDLKIRCFRCNWVVEKKNGRFQCPNGCFSLSLQEVLGIYSSIR